MDIFRAIWEAFLAFLEFLMHPSWWAATLWRWGRVIWVCRVPVFSAFGGGLLVSFASQALDLYADLGLYWWQWLFFFFLVFGWAWIVHATARRSLQFDDWLWEAHRPKGLSADCRVVLRAAYIWPALLVPRFLGLLVFFFVGWGMCRSRRNLLPASSGLPEAADAVSLINVLLGVLVVTALVYVFAVWKRRDAVARLRSAAGPDAPLLTGEVPIFVLISRPGHYRDVTKALFRSRLSRALTVASVIITIAFVIAVVNPNFLADWIPRALFVPVMLGGSVLLLAEIAALSHRWETPLLLIGTLIGGGLNYYFDHYNDVRWASPPPSPVAGATQQISFAKAVQRWRQVNCKPDCPRPIVIAAAGGASRAGFFTATVVGAMIDASADPAMGDVRNRIFALSSVSGSSVGAIMMRAAWLDALENGDVTKPPCTDATNGAWFGSFRVSESRSKRFNAKTSWRDCFQQLMAGDFLSPVFVGLAYRDGFPLGNPFSRRAAWYDRTVLLERAFERRYFDITAKGAASCAEADKNGLCRRFGYHPDLADKWIPLLFINGSSVASGRRILLSDVRVGCGILQLAYDYRELRDPQSRNAEPCPPEVAAKPDARYDLMLSTASTMSARFPLISTQGVIRDVDDGFVDSIVDGGYFENEGLATLAEIVEQLRNSELDPLVVRIVNEPFKEVPPERNLGSGRPELPPPGQRALFDVYTSIAQAIEATRSGHENEAGKHLENVAGKSGPVVTIGVYEPRPGSNSPLCREPIQAQSSMKVVSMSWWMSQPVQAYLDAQLCAPENQKLVCALRLKPKQEVSTCN